MEILASTAQMKELDRIAIEERGIPSLELMENAAQAVAQAVMDLVGPAKNPKGADGPACIGFMTKTGEEPTLEEQREMEELRSIVESKNADPTQRIGIFCGPGNNGGDGVAAARILLEAGYRVRAFLVGDRAKMTPDERAMEEKLKDAGASWNPWISMTSAPPSGCPPATALWTPCSGWDFSALWRGNF